MRIVKPIILIVDDNACLAASYKEELSELGCDILISASVEDALKTLDEHQAILAVLTDYRLQDGDGLELVSFFRKRRPNRHWVEFVLVTGHGTLEMAQLAIDAEIRQFLTKPIAASALRASMKAAVSSAGMRQQAAMAHDTISQSLTDFIDHMSSLSPRRNGGVIPVEEGTSDYKFPSIALLAMEKRRLGELNSAGISEKEWAILIQMYVSAISNKTTTLKSVAYDLNIPLSTLIRIANDLCERGYLDRSIDVSDARRSILQLTPKGAGVVEVIVRSDYANGTR